MVEGFHTAFSLQEIQCKSHGLVLLTLHHLLDLQFLFFWGVGGHIEVIRVKPCVT